jgi:hypothetical protein
MKKLLAILLLVLLPGQIAWSAVGSLCQHENGASANHLGHHNHQHKLDPVGDTSSDKAKFGDKDSDCTVCHAGYASVIPEFSSFVANFTAVRSPAASSGQLMPPLPDRPERPQWRHLA